MKEFNYYKSQLNELKNRDEPITIKLTDYDGNSTKYLTLNSKSIVELELLLNELKDSFNKKAV